VLYLFLVIIDTLIHSKDIYSHMIIQLQNNNKKKEKLII